MRRILSAVAALTLGVATTASAASFNTTLKQTARVSLTAIPSGCENNPGPYITLNGGVSLSGVTARIILTNNAKGTHLTSADVSSDVVLIPGGETIQIAKQPSRGGVGGNPWIYFQFTDGKGGTLGSPIKLGRCVQGLTNVNGSFGIPTAVAAALTGGCSNNPGPFINLGGDLRMGGLGGRIILTNNAKFTHVASADVSADVVLIPAGESIRIAKQPSRGGVGGNPWIYFQYTDCKGGTLGSPIRLGRCVQGLGNVNGNFGIPTAIAAALTGGCSNNPGPFITLGGDLRMGGLCGQIILTNNAKFTHVASEDVCIDVTLLEDGKTLTFAKQPPLGGAGGNPHIWVQFLDGSGKDLCAPIYVGRCVQL